VTKRKPNPLGDAIAKVLREVRDETARKVRLAEFAERMPVERYRATEAKLAAFSTAVDEAADAMEGGDDE